MERERVLFQFQARFLEAIVTADTEPDRLRPLMPCRPDRLFVESHATVGIASERLRDLAFLRLDTRRGITSRFHPALPSHRVSAGA